MLSMKNRSMFMDIVNRSRVEPLRQQMEKNVKDAMLGRMEPWKKCQTTTDTINSLMWNTAGDLLLSASSDSSISLCNPFNKLQNRIKTPHQSKIICARFFPGSENLVVSGSRYDGVLCYDWSLANQNTIQQSIFRCYTTEKTCQVITIPTEPNLFISCHTDQTVRLFDIRCVYNDLMRDSNDSIIIRTKDIPTAMSLAPISQRYIAVGTKNGLVNIYDRRMLGKNTPTALMKVFCQPTLGLNTSVTSLSYDDSEQHILCGFYLQELHMFEVANHPGLSEGSVLRHKTEEIVNVPRRSNSPRVSDEDWMQINRHVADFVAFMEMEREESLDELVDAVDGWDAEEEEENEQIMLVSSDSDSDDDFEASEFRQAVDEMDAGQENSDHAAGPSAMQQNCYKGSNEFSYAVQSYETGQSLIGCSLTETGFWGDKYIFAGSNCGNVFFWDKRKDKCVMTLVGNHQLVTTVQAHPTQAILAAGGSDGVIKCFMPMGEYSLFDDENIPEVQLKKKKQQQNRHRPPSHWMDRNTISFAIF